MFTTFFKKNQDNSDIFKKLIHRLSDMPVQNLEKIDRLLDIIFTPEQESELHKEQLEKNLERFKKKSQLRTKIGA